MSLNPNYNTVLGRQGSPHSLLVSQITTPLPSVHFEVTAVVFIGSLYAASLLPLFLFSGILKGFSCPKLISISTALLNQVSPSKHCLDKIFRVILGLLPYLPYLLPYLHTQPASLCLLQLQNILRTTLVQLPASLSRFLQKPLTWSSSFHQCIPTVCFPQDKLSEPSCGSSSPIPSHSSLPPNLCSPPHDCLALAGLGQVDSVQGLCIWSSYCLVCF